MQKLSAGGANREITPVLSFFRNGDRCILQSTANLFRCHISSAHRFMVSDKKRMKTTIVKKLGQRAAQHANTGKRSFAREQDAEGRNNLLSSFERDKTRRTNFLVSAHFVASVYLSADWWGKFKVGVFHPFYSICNSATSSTIVVLHFKYFIIVYIFFILGQTQLTILRDASWLYPLPAHATSLLQPGL
jgi:hypothetical protein